MSVPRWDETEAHNGEPTEQERLEAMDRRMEKADPEELAALADNYRKEIHGE